MLDKLVSELIESVKDPHNKVFVHLPRETIRVKDRTQTGKRDGSPSKSEAT